MKDWQKNLIIIFCPLLILVYFVIKENKKAEVSHRRSDRSIASVPQTAPPVTGIPKNAVSRKLATVKGLSQRYSQLIYRVPQSVEESFKKNPSVKVSAGYEFLEDVAAIPRENFEPSLGNVIQKTEKYVYFRAEKGHTFIPVAISASTNILYPISSILHVREATPEVRAELLAKGFTQYYYHPPIKLLSLETKSGEVVKVYSSLKKKGYKVELEVLKPQPKTF